MILFMIHNIKNPTEVARLFQDGSRLSLGLEADQRQAVEIRGLSATFTDGIKSES